MFNPKSFQNHWAVSRSVSSVMHSSMVTSTVCLQVSPKYLPSKTKSFQLFNISVCYVIGRKEIKEEDRYSTLKLYMTDYNHKITGN